MNKKISLVVIALTWHIQILVMNKELNKNEDYSEKAKQRVHIILEFHDLKMQKETLVYWEFKRKDYIYHIHNEIQRQNHLSNCDAEIARLNQEIKFIDQCITEAWKISDGYQESDKNLFEFKNKQDENIFDLLENAKKYSAKK